MNAPSPAGYIQPTCRRGRWSGPLRAGLLVLLLSISSGTASDAQTGGRDQLQQYLERNQELLEWAKELVVETGSGPARRVLSQANDLHQRSQGLFQGGRMLESYNVARRSRAAIGHAVRIARESMGLEERIRIRADRLREQHGQLMERARDLNSAQAVDFLQRARLQADRAREQYRQGDFKLAWKILEQADDLMRRAARILADAVGPERLEREIERTGMLIGQARDRVADDPDAAGRKLLEDAEDAQRRAREALGQGETGRALQMTTLARRLATRAGRMQGSAPDQEAVRRQLERFDERATAIGDRIREAGSEPARNIYEKARQRREQAANSLAAGEDEQALRQIRAAHDFLNQAEDLIR